MEDTKMLPIKLCVYEKERTNSIGEPMLLMSCYQVPHTQYTPVVDVNVSSDGKILNLESSGCFIKTVGNCGLDYPQSRFFPWETHSALCSWEEYLKALGFHFKMTLPADLVTDCSDYNNSHCMLKMKNILTVIINTKRYM